MNPTNRAPLLRYRDYLQACSLASNWDPACTEVRRLRRRPAGRFCGLHEARGLSSAARPRPRNWPGSAPSWPMCWPPLPKSVRGGRAATWVARRLPWKATWNCRPPGWSACSPPTRPRRANGPSVRLLRLAAALARLPHDQREVVELHHLKGLPVAEVAAEMGRTRPAVVGLLFRGLKKLRELLRESGEGEG